jgi:hypothetical protein
MGVIEHIRSVGRKTLMEKDILKTLTYMGNHRVYLKLVACDEVNCIYLAQDKEKRLAVVNTLMNLQVPKRRETS